MQPFTAQLAAARFLPQDAPIPSGAATYRAFPEAGYVEEDSSAGKRKLAIAHAMGGKNTYYLLTPMERGRLQVLPIGYDVASRKWYDVAAAGVRVHAGSHAQAPLAWTDPAFTFNTSCYGCHTSQIKTNYDAATDSYNTTWKEPGINCETCHGDASAHLKRAGGTDILRVANLTATQRNEMCAPCHAKMSPLSAGYQVTQRFLDHYDLTALESADFHPDGRDLGENYTYTSWLMNSCNRNQQFDCLHCHTSTGAFRFAKNPDEACLPCHQGVAAKGKAHTHHELGAGCIGCHMPKTRFANMVRSDHSLRAPTPEATRAFGSPNACTICHTEQDAAWADATARKWYGSGYQDAAMDRAHLIDDARKRKWNRAPAMLAALRDAKSNPVFTASLLRLLRTWDDSRKLPVAIEKLQDASPLVRAAAAASLADSIAESSVQAALFRATADDFRLVRIRAAASLAPMPPESIPADAKASRDKATGELAASFHARPDDYTGQTSLGNFHLRRGEMARSLEAFERAIRLRPDSVGTLVNASVAYSRAGRAADAERVLRQAAQYAPQNAAVQFNLGLLLAESKRLPEAEAALRAALAADPQMAAAAYNLAIMVSARDRKEAIALCRKAVAVSAEARYVKALAQFLAKDGQIAEAKRVFGSLKK